MPCRSVTRLRCDYKDIIKPCHYDIPLVTHWIDMVPAGNLWPVSHHHSLSDVGRLINPASRTYLHPPGHSCHKPASRRSTPLERPWGQLRRIKGPFLQKHCVTDITAGNDPYLIELGLAVSAMRLVVSRPPVTGSSEL